MDPEGQSPSYAQLVVNVHDFRDVPAMVAELDSWFKENLPQALIPLRRYGIGPDNTWKFEARISGPAVADPVVLRSLAGQAMAILKTSPFAGHIRTNWRQRVQKVST